MIDVKTTQNAQKVAFLVNEYPEHTMGDILKLIQGPPIDTNSAIWAAVELGYITNPDTSENCATVVKLPHKWDFGPDVDHLVQTLEFAFQNLGKKEMDLGEVYLSNWTLGYAPDDHMLAVNLLLKRKVLSMYVLEDTDEKGVVNEYTFYTSYENRYKEWGRKQFKRPDSLSRKKN